VADVVNHAATNEGGVDFVGQRLFDDHGAEVGGVHFVGREANGVGIDPAKDIGRMRHGLGGVDDDDAAGTVDFFDERLDVLELAAIEICGAVENNESAGEIVIVEIDRAVWFAVYDFPFDLVFAGADNGGEKNGVVFDVGGHDFGDKFGADLGEDEVDTVGSVEGEADEMVFGAEL